MFDHLEDYLLRAWHQLPHAGTAPRHLSFMGQATGVSKVCFFIFADDEASPRYIAKLPRSPAYNDELMGEIVAIQSLRQVVTDELKATLPGPMHVVSLSGHYVIIEPVLPGQPMDALTMVNGRLDPSSTARQVALAHHWLIEIQQNAPHRRQTIDAATLWDQFVEPLERMKTNSELTQSEEKHAEEVCSELRALEGRDLPLYLYHGDFRPGNILVDGDRIAVLDWQFSRPLAPPLLDWFSFVFRLYSGSVQLPDIDGSLEKYRAAFHEVFFARNWFSELVADYTRAYCKALHVEEAYVPLLFSLFVVNNVNHFHSFLTERARRGYLYLLRGAPSSGQSWKRQVRRQAYVWLLGDIAVSPTCWPMRHIENRRLEDLI